MHLSPVQAEPVRRSTTASTMRGAEQSGTKLFPVPFESGVEQSGTKLFPVPFEG